MTSPRYVYRLYWSAALLRLEQLVPGAYVSGWVGRWYAIKRIEAPQKIEHWQVEVAWHSAWRVSELLSGTEHTVTPFDIKPEMFVTDPDWLHEYGKSLAAYAVERGELREDAISKLTSYQMRVFALAATRPSVFLRWNAGSGKSQGGFNAIMAREGNAIVLCPASARQAWRSEAGRSRSSAEKFTLLETHRVLPESERNKNHEPLDEYLARMREMGKRAIVVAGMESLGDHLDDLRRVQARTLVVDELHTLGAPKRVDVSTDENGIYKFKRAKTAGGDALRVLHAVELSGFPSLELRVGLTATPIDKSMRRVWSQADLLSPGGFGYYSNYRQRYTSFRINEEGYPEDSGSSHVDELRQRFCFFTSDVPRSVTHRELPPLRLETVYLASPDRRDVPEEERQNRPDAFAAELRTLAKLAGSGSAARGRLREAALAESCSRKRRACTLWGREVLGEGGKVVVFMGRRAMVEQWGALWREEFPGVDGWAVTGDDSERERDRVIDAFAEHAGPCWLIGTGHSIGLSKDGMQCAQLGIVAQLPEKAGMWLQWIGRMDRIGGVGTVIRVPIAEGSADERELTRLTRQFGAIERFTDSPELRAMADSLDGVDDDEGLIASIVEKLARQSLPAEVER